MTACKGCKVLSWHYMALTYRVLEYLHLLYNYTTKKSWFALDNEGYEIVDKTSVSLSLRFCMRLG